MTEIAGHGEIASSIADDPHTALTLTSFPGPKDVLVITSHSGTTVEALEVAAVAHESGATVVAITGHATSPLTHQTDHVLLGVAGAESDLRPAVTGSRMSQLAIVEALFVVVAQRTAERSRPLLARGRHTIRTHHRSWIEHHAPPRRPPRGAAAPRDRGHQLVPRRHRPRLHPRGCPAHERRRPQRACGTGAVAPSHRPSARLGRRSVRATADSSTSAPAPRADSASSTPARAHPALVPTPRRSSASSPTPLSPSRPPSKARKTTKQLAVRDLDELGLTADAVVVGISASGRTPYVIAAILEARRRSALSVSVACNPNSAAGRGADIAIDDVVAPEFVAGSTSLEARTAQKLVLNMLTTLAMMRSNKTVATGWSTWVRRTRSSSQGRSRSYRT